MHGWRRSGAWSFSRGRHFPRHFSVPSVEATSDAFQQLHHLMCDWLRILTRRMVTTFTSSNRRKSWFLDFWIQDLAAARSGCFNTRSVKCWILHLSDGHLLYVFEHVWNQRYPDEFSSKHKVYGPPMYRLNASRSLKTIAKLILGSFNPCLVYIPVC